MTKTNPNPVWKIASLERETATGKVTTVHYTVGLSDGTYNAGAYGSIGLEGEMAVAYEDLTEDIVVGWVKFSLGDEKVQEMRVALEAQLENQRAPKVASGLPWSTAT